MRVRVQRSGCGNPPLPPPPLSSSNLWNQRVAVGVWLQNIDSRDLVCKFSGMNTLRGLSGIRFCGQFAVSSFAARKAKDCARRSLISLTLYLYYSDFDGINMQRFCDEIFEERRGDFEFSSSQGA